MKKFLVLVVGIVVAGLAVCVRSCLVVRDFARDRARVGAACAASVEKTIESESPMPSFRTALAYRRRTPPPIGTRLATLKLPGRVKDHQRVLDSPSLQYQCLYDAIVDLGANAYVIEGIEPDTEKPDFGKLVEGVYLIAAPALPEPFGIRFPQRVSFVSSLFDGGAAERAGLRVGDLAVDLDHRGLGEGAGENTAVDDAVDELADGAAATMTVVRDGRALDLPVLKERGKYGYQHHVVPVLPSAR